MEYLIDTDKITLDYSEDRKDRDFDEFRLTIFDNNNHYIGEIQLNAEHLLDLVNGLKNINLENYIEK